MNSDKEQNGILARIVNSIGGVASALQQIASFIRAQTLSHSHTGGTDGQQIANAGIASDAAIAISKTTLGTFTAWAAWTPTYGGFSADPTVVAARWCQIGKVVFVHYRTNAPGTSNSTGLAVNLPVATLHICTFNLSRMTNNGSIIAGPGIGITTAGGTTMTCYIDQLGNAWSASSTKSIDFEISYEVA